jgi:predicted acylesterase/phospholipase RssA
VVWWFGCLRILQFYNFTILQYVSKNNKQSFELKLNIELNIKKMETSNGNDNFFQSDEDFSDSLYTILSELQSPQHRDIQKELHHTLVPPSNRPLRMYNRRTNEYKPNITNRTSIFNPKNSSNSNSNIGSGNGEIPMQENPDWIYDIRYMTISGGGAKGYAYTGAIITLDNAFVKKKRNLYKQLKGISGTSIGAVFALFITLGVRGRQLIREVLHTDVSHVTKHISIENFMEMYGLNRSDKFRQQIFDILEKHTGKGDITFRELYELTKKHYVCCVANVTLARAEYHSYMTTPNYKVFESVAASMSIPLLFVPNIINGHYYVDGGVVDNCPFSVFPPDENFIIYVEGDYPDLSSMPNYIKRLTMMSLRSIDENRFNSLQPEQQKRRFLISIRDVSTLDFNISMEGKKNLLLRGAKQMDHFLNPHAVVTDYIKLFTKMLCHHVIETSKILSDKEKEDKHETSNLILNMETNNNNNSTSINTNDKPQVTQTPIHLNEPTPILTNVDVNANEQNKNQVN